MSWPMRDTAGVADEPQQAEIDWEHLDPLWLQDLRYGTELFEALGDPAKLPLPLVRVFDRAVNADLWMEAGDEDEAAESLLQAQELLEEAIGDPLLATFTDQLIEARWRLRADFISARKTVEPT